MLTWCFLYACPAVGGLVVQQVDTIATTDAEPIVNNRG